MRFLLKTLTVLFAVALLARTADAASLTASLDRDTIMLGEQATLSLKFEGVQTDAPEIPSVPGLQIRYVGPSSSFSFINGRTSSSVTHTYVVSAQRAGDFTIPALALDVGGQRLTTGPLKLEVTKPSAPTTSAVNSGNEVAFLKIIFPKDRVYVGQAAVAQLELFLRDDVQNFGNFQMTGMSTEGFSAGKIVEGQRRRTQIGNRTYTVVPLLVPLTVVKPGALELGPFTASAVVVLPGQNQGGDPFFRQFFNQGEQKQVTLTTETVAVESLPLPTQGRPANFTGAVGDYAMSATAGPTAVTVGDPITVRVQISGRGALDSLTLPTQDAWHDFKTYPPTAKVEADDQFGFQGKKTFEQIISPLNSDVHELPPLTFAFFNPNDGQYHTLTQAAVPLIVKAAAATPMPTLAAARNPAPENQPAPDILPLKDRLGTIETNSRPFIVQPGFLAMQSVPLLAFIAAFVWRRRTDRLANNPRLRRQRAVAQLIRDGLNDLKRHATANQPDEFFALLFRLLQEQLGERLDCPASAITENVIDEHAALQSAPGATLDSLRELFQLCNQARYAPVRGSAELNSVAAQFEKVICELQEMKV